MNNIIIYTIYVYNMGTSNSNAETSSIGKIKDIDEEQLDLSNIDKLQLRAIKQTGERSKSCKKKNLPS